MSVAFDGLPFDKTRFMTKTELDKGLTLGMVFRDTEDGKLYRLVSLTNAAVSGAIAANDTLAYEAGVAAGQYRVTNDHSAAINGATDPLPAGIAPAAFTDSVDTTDANLICILALIRGQATLNTPAATDDIVAGEPLVLDPATDKAVIDWTPTTLNPTLAQLRQGQNVMAYALADDDDTADTVVAYVNVRS